MNETTTTGNTVTMPADAATRILCEPKNRTTGKLRRKCWSSRIIYTDSFLPITTYPGGGLVRTVARKAKMPKQLKRTLGRATSAEDKLKHRLTGKFFKQLLVMEKRTARQIRNLTKMADVLGSDLKENQLAARLRERIAQLHAIGNLLQKEIDSRS